MSCFFILQIHHLFLPTIHRLPVRRAQSILVGTFIPPHHLDLWIKPQTGLVDFAGNFTESEYPTRISTRDMKKIERVNEDDSLSVLFIVRAEKSLVLVHERADFMSPRDALLAARSSRYVGLTMGSHDSMQVGLFLCDRIYFYEIKFNH